MLRSRAAGFTLMELMIALVIIGIAAAIAVPSIREFRGNALVTTGVNDLIQDFAVARAEAARTGYVVAVCRSSDSAECDTSTDGDWAIGRLIFVDRNSDGVLDDGENVISRIAASKTGLRIVVSDTSINRIAYGPSGIRSRGASDVFFSVCAQGMNERRVTVSAAGRTQVTRTETECS